MPNTRHPPLHLVQSSAWHAFRYDLVDDGGQRLGGFEFAKLAQASNARLKWHAEGSSDGDIHLDLVGTRYRVVFEYLTRAWNNDLEYRLMQGDEVLARLHIRHVAGQRRPTVQLLQPQLADLVLGGHPFRRRLDLIATGSTQPLGQVDSGRVLTLRRRWTVTGDTLPAPLKAFLGVVVVCLRV